MITKTKCSICDGSVEEIVDLGKCPPANNFVKKKNEMVNSYPLIVDFCNKCFCIQLRHCLSKNELYSYYTYSTPKIDSLADHYANLLKKLKKLGYAKKKQSCIEIGSNNGNLLKFLQPNFHKVLGVDPAANIAKIARNNGVETIIEFFSNDVADQISNEYNNFNVAIARHMFAHNEDPGELLSAMDKILDENGVFIIENAYAIDTFKNGEFDQIYHEHMFYYSVKNMENYLKSRQYDLNDILLTDIHGGSIVFISSKENTFPISSKVNSQLEYEQDLLKDDLIFNNFLDIVKEVKLKTLGEIDSDVAQQKKVIAYGAPAKAFTMFSTLELDNRKIAFCVDTSVTKIGKIFPTFNIPIISENDLSDKEYDTVLVTAWNYKEDILKRSEDIFKKGTKLIFPLPEFEILYV